MFLNYFNHLISVSSFKCLSFSYQKESKRKGKFTLKEKRRDQITKVAIELRYKDIKKMSKYLIFILFKI